MSVRSGLSIFTIAALLLAGCAQPMTKTQQGAAVGTGVGAAVGAGLGQAIGGNTKGTLLGAGIGAVVGGLAGAGIGNYMEKQEAALNQQFAASEAASVRREANVLAVTFKSDVLFDSGSAALKPGAYQEINRVAQVLIQYPETRILVSGHTDSDGSEAFNQDLSVRRADNVRSALVGQGVQAARISTIGYGETQPIADNTTQAGKQLNRRVVITIEPT